MKNSLPFDDSSRQWEMLARYIAGELESGERQVVEAMLAEDPALRERLDILRRTQLQSSRGLSAATGERMLDGIFAAGAQAEAANELELPRRRASWRPILAAAVLAGLIAGGWMVWQWRAPVADWSIVTAKAGSRSSVTLPDGTEVTLNAGSELSYPTDFGKLRRNVKLKGEGYFRVKGDPEHPFVISTPLVDVRVLGTELNLRAWPNESTTETALISGALEVIVKDKQEQRIILKPNQKVAVDKRFMAFVSKEEGRQQKVNTIAGKAIRVLPLEQNVDNAIAETAWLNNKLVFKSQPFGELAAAIERAYGVKVEFRNEQLKDVNFSGVIKDETLHELMSILQTMKSFEYTLDSAKVIIE